MVKPTSLMNISSFLLSHSPNLPSAIRFTFFSRSHSHSHTHTRLLSTTPYPLQYELIINRPSQPHPRPPPVRPNDSTDHPNSDEAQPKLDKAQRKYYNKRRKRMYGSDSDSDNNNSSSRHDQEFVELKPQVVDFPTLHKREEELHFYDAFTYPWEKEKHYKMVYQLEKKYFPDQCLDKAFLQPGQSNVNANSNSNSNGRGKGRKKVGSVGDDKLVFFEGKGEEEEEAKGKVDGSGGNRQVKEKKVEEFFKGLKKDNKEVQVGQDPFLSSRRTGLPPVWDTPHGTVVLVNKPKGQLPHYTLPSFLRNSSYLCTIILVICIQLGSKFLAGWTSFTVCGKLRRLVKVKKVLFQCTIFI